MALSKNDAAKRTSMTFRPDAHKKVKALCKATGLSIENIIHLMVMECDQDELVRAAMPLKDAKNRDRASRRDLYKILSKMDPESVRDILQRVDHLPATA